MSSTAASLLTLSTPFAGLRAFEPEESLLFFGRETHTEELLHRLGSNRFLAVVGPSGCGKSSVIKAGLLPALQRGYLVGASSRWKVATMRPGPAPLEAMAEAVSAALMSDRNATRVMLGATSRGLVEVVRSSQLTQGDSMLLVVDQFEEIFRYSDDKDRERKAGDASLFVAALLAAVDQSDAPIYIVITMRSDFLGDCAEFPGLPEALNRSQYLVPRLTREQRRDAIVRPLQLVGAKPSERLVQAVLNDVGDDPDQLPVLQHALLRTFRCWEAHGSAGTVDMPHYDAAGGIARALDAHAREVLESVGSDNLDLTRRIFRALTTTDNGRTIRRPRQLERLHAIVAANHPETREGVNRIVATFARREHSLLLLSSPTLSTGTVVDIAHESLIRKWVALRQWAQEEQKSADWLRDLGTAVTRRKRGEGMLWEDPNLSHVLQRKRDESWNAAWAEQYCSSDEVAFDDIESFLGESSETQEATRERERAQHQKELDDARALASARRRTTAALALVLVTFAAAAVLFYLLERRRLAEADSAAQRIALLLDQQEATAREAEELRLRAQEFEKRINEATGAERARLSAEYEQLKEKGTAAEQEAERLRTQLNGLQTQAPVKGTDNTALLSRIEYLQKEVSTLTGERNRLEKSNNDRPSRDVSAPRIQELTARLEEATRERDDARAEVATTRDALDKAQTSVDSLRIEVADLKRRLAPNDPPRGSSSSLPTKATIPSGVYIQAMDAFDRKRWAEAVRLFEQAGNQLGDRRETVRFSKLRSEPYLPNYYRGLALKELGRCREAIAAWDMAEKQAAVDAGTPAYKRLRDARAACAAY